MDSGPEPISDAEILNAVRRQARRVQWNAVAGAALITALYLVIS
jgi:hypothetical protein